MSSNLGPYDSPDISGVLLKCLSDYAKLSDIVNNYVNGGNIQTVANLIVNYPPNATNLGKYARVSDLWGGVDEIMRCSYDGNMYYWRPQRTDYAISTAQTSGNMVLTPLVSAPSIFMTATLLGSIDLQLQTTNAYPGETFEVTAPSILGLNTLRFTGLIGGAVSNLLVGSSKKAVYTSAGWRII